MEVITRWLRMSFRRHPFLYLLLASFILPVLIMAGVLWTRGIYWSSETTILVSDAFHQYAPFATTLSHILHGEGSLFYTLTSGLGLNFYALISYYLGSVFSLLYYFFTAETMANGIYLVTLLKFGSIGLSAAYSLKKGFPKLQSLAVLLLSTSYSVMSFATSQLEINMWLDAFMLLPLIVLGLQELVTAKKSWLYYLTLTLLFIQNYYMGYMVAIFLVGYVLVLISWNVKARWKNFFHFALVSILSGLSSAFMLLPSYLDLSSHGESFSSFTDLLTDNSWYLDFFAKNLVASYDTTKYGAIPMIYVGLVPLIFALIFFTLKSIKWTVKLAYLTFIAFFIASFYLQPLDLAWQAMHAPNMFLHRYAWLFSYLIVLMAAESLTRLDKFGKKGWLFPFVLLSLGFLATWIFAGHYAFLENFNFVISFTFVLAYGLSFLALSRRQFSPRAFMISLFLFGLFEVTINTYYQVNGLGNEWNFPSLQGYQGNIAQTESLLTRANQQKQGFYRTEETLPQTGNDSMKYNYNGISQFSSIRNTRSSHTMDLLGFKSSGTNLNLRYQNNTLLMDSLFGVAFNLSAQSPEKFGFSLVEQANSLGLYQNSYAQSLAIMTAQTYEDADFNLNTLDNQTSLVNQLTGLDLQYFTRLTSSLDTIDNVTTTNSGFTVSKAVNDIYTTVTYTVNIPANRQVYVSLPNLNFGNSSNNKVEVVVNGNVQTFTTDNTFSFFNIGYFDQDTQASVTLQFPDTQQVSFSAPTFYALNIPNYQQAMARLQQGQVETSVSGNTVTSSYQADQATSLFYTIPYDKGWTATDANGQSLTIRQAQEGFMVVDIPEGSGQVTLTFVPQGFKEGSLLSLLGFGLYLLYRLTLRLWKKRQAHKQA